MDGLLTRRRADELDAALSGSVPEQRADLTADLRVVARLRHAGAALDPAPPDEFRTALRARLLAVAAVQGIGETATSPQPAAVSWRQRAATVAAGVTAGVVAVTGVAVAGSQSLPGDPFYGVKRTTEQLQLRLADGAREEGERHLQLAEERLGEARELAGGGTLSDDDERRVLEALSDMDADTRAASRLLTQDFRTTREPAALQLLSRFAQDQRSGLTALLPVLDGAADDAVRDSLALVDEVGTQAGELLLLLDCTTACDPTASAPALPVPGAGPGPATSAPCACPTPPPAPSVAPAPSAAPPGATPDPSAPATPASPQPSSAPTSPPPGSPSPAPSPSGGPGLPLPTTPGVPLPTLPDLPLPTLPSLEDPLLPVPVPPLTGPGGVVDGLTGGLTGALADVVAGGPAALAVGWLQDLL